jgi:tetratricopeptide (TPR) repeat protein
MLQQEEIVTEVDSKEEGLDEKNKELFRGLLDQLAEEDGNLVPGRNEPCYCSSGKKYKKCCLAKDQERVRIPSEPTKVEEFYLSNDEIKDSVDSPPFSEEEYKDWEECYRRITEDPKLLTEEDVALYEAFCEKYPDFPTIWNNLSCAYQVQENKKKVREITEVIFKKFPDYLFGQVNMANLYLEDNNLEKAEEILQGKYTLKQFYPGRVEFHISEFIALQSAQIRIALAKEDIPYAQRLHEQLLQTTERFEIDEHTMVSSIGIELKRAKLKRKFSVARNRFFN